MGENQPTGRTARPYELLWFRLNRWGAAALLLVVGGLTLGYGVRQRDIISRFASSEAEVSATIGQIQSQLAAIAAKLDEISAAQTEPGPPANRSDPISGHSDGTVAIAKRLRAEEDHWKKMQARIDQQQKQLDETKASLAETRLDFENLNSTHKELNDTVAKTHEQLIALEKRGERNYSECDLSKSKEFQRCGPLMLSLRNADPKRQNLDLAIVVNDNELTKKKINLYEPVWIYENSDQAPLQVVVNKISKDRVHGYVSAPRYSRGELASNAAPGAALSSVQSQTTNSQVKPAH